MKQSIMQTQPRAPDTRPRERLEERYGRIGIQAVAAAFAVSTRVPPSQQSGSSEAGPRQPEDKRSAGAKR